MGWVWDGHCTSGVLKGYFEILGLVRGSDRGQCNSVKCQTILGIEELGNWSLGTLKVCFL
jgi:hypothetical protein